MGQMLYDVVAPEERDTIYWAYSHEELILAGILLFVLIVAGILIAVLVKVIKNGSGKEQPVVNAGGSAADDQIKPKE